MYKESDLLFSKDHEWIKVEGNIGRIGISLHAQDSLGDIVYVGLPKSGTAITQHQAIGSIESVKAVSELLSPASGKVFKINTELETNPEYVNQEPYGKGWMMEIELSKPSELKGLMDYQAYTLFLKEQA